MHITVNAASLRGYGSAIIGRALLSELLAVDSNHEITAWVPRGWTAEPWSPGVKLRVGNSGGWKKPGFEYVRLPREMRTVDASVFFNLCDTGSPSGNVPQLLMLQQAHFAYEPNAWGYLPDPRTRVRFALLTAYFRAGLQHVQHFTVQTEDMRSRLAARWNIDPSRITVIPSSVDAHVLRAAARPPTAPLSKPYICYVASPAQHKNHAVLASTMAGLRRSHPELTCRLMVERPSVPALVAEAKRYDILDRFEFVGPQPQEQALEILQGASAAIIPSVLESFGLSYYEAMALGVPVIAANRAFASEACGDAAVYAPSNSGEAFAASIATVLSNREDWSNRSRRRFDAVHVPCMEVARRYTRLLEALA